MNSNTNKRKRPLNPRQEKFAQLVAQGIPASQAYLQAGYSRQQHDARANGCLLLKIPRVAARVAEIQHLAASLETTLLTILEKRRFLAAVIRTPVGSIGPESPLCQAFREVVRVQMPLRDHSRDQQNDKPGDDGTAGPELGKEIIIRRRVRIVDKLRAIALDSKLAGHFSKPHTHTPALIHKKKSAPAQSGAGAAPLSPHLEALKQTALRVMKERGPILPWLR